MEIFRSIRRASYLATHALCAKTAGARIEDYWGPLLFRTCGGSKLIRILQIGYHLPVLGGLHHEYEWEAA